MQFRDKTAYVWGLRYRWDPSLSRNWVPWFPHFMPPCLKVKRQISISLSLTCIGTHIQQLLGFFFYFFAKKIFKVDLWVPFYEGVVRGWNEKEEMRNIHWWCEIVWLRKYLCFWSTFVIALTTFMDVERIQKSLRHLVKCFLTWEEKEEGRNEHLNILRLTWQL